MTSLCAPVLLGVIAVAFTLSGRNIVTGPGPAFLRLRPAGGLLELVFFSTREVDADRAGRRRDETVRPRAGRAKGMTAVV
jgi:hypothetical protein